MINSEHKERCPVSSLFPVLARAGSGGEFVGAEDVLRPEVAGAAAIDAGKKTRHFVRGKRRQARDRGMAIGLQRFVQCGPNIAAHGVIPRHRFVGALQHDDILLAGERLDHGRFRERPNDIEVNRSYRRPACSRR